MPETLRTVNLKRAITGIFPVIASLFCLCGFACGEEAAEDPEAAYRRAIRGRSERIVDQLGIADSSQRERVVTIVADQYRALRDAHAAEDQALEEATEPEQVVRDKAHREVVALHRRFIALLSSELPDAQVTRVKDGMTYGVVPNTYGAYLRLLPGLSDEEKRTIHAHLIEAREYAMDAGSSDEKHGWFGKYKGRINNYLSARGYNLKQAERDLAKRGDD